MRRPSNFPSLLTRPCTSTYFSYDGSLIAGLSSLGGEGRLHRSSHRPQHYDPPVAALRLFSGHAEEQRPIPRGAHRNIHGIDWAAAEQSPALRILIHWRGLHHYRIESSGRRMINRKRSRSRAPRTRPSAHARSSASSRTRSGPCPSSRRASSAGFARTCSPSVQAQAIRARTGAFAAWTRPVATDDGHQVSVG